MKSELNKCCVLLVHPKQVVWITEALRGYREGGVSLMGNVIGEEKFRALWEMEELLYRGKKFYNLSSFWKK